METNFCQKTNLNVHIAQISICLQIFTPKFIILERTSQGCNKLIFTKLYLYVTKYRLVQSCYNLKKKKISL